MANTFFLEIIVPDRKFFSDQVESLVLKTPAGELGILPEHIPMVVATSIGPIRIKQTGQWRTAFLSTGFMEVARDKTIILANTAEWPEEIDVQRARDAEERALERLKDRLGQVEYVQAQAALQRAVSRLKVSSFKDPS